MKYTEWKSEVVWYLERARSWKNSKYRQEREYANYLLRFFFGTSDVDVTKPWDWSNETWKAVKARQELPMPTNIYLYG